jgi:hypothetical protein
MTEELWNCAAEYREINGQLEPFVWRDGKLVQVAWAPLPGSQAAFMGSPEQIILYQGPRGSGKTLPLLMDFLQFVNIGLGPEHKGILFRQSFPQLDEVISIARSWIPRIFPEAGYNATHYTWTFPAGETLRFRQLPDEAAYENFHGQAATWIGMEELANWPTLEPMKLLLSLLNRSTHPLAPNHMRLTSNTYGVGRDAIMEYFHLLPAPSPMFGPLIIDDEGPPRRVITGDLRENLPLLYRQPNYADNIRNATKGNPAKEAAWLQAIWAAPPTAFFGDVDFGFVKVPAFEPPYPGRVRLGLDHGFTAPTAVVFCWESRGEDIEFADGTRRTTRKGDVFVVDELYTASKPNVGLKLPPSEIARRIHAIVERHGWNPRILPAPGNVADTSIFSPGMNDNRASIAQDFENSGIIFEWADKARVLGAAEILKRLMAAKPPEGALREEPALFITENCVNLLRSLPNLQRDESDAEDIESEGNDDHLYDALRYFLRREKTPTLSTRRRYAA